MTHTADIFDERESWGGALGASLAVHVFIALIVTGWAWIAVHYRGSQPWGAQGAGPGGAISATMVSTIPLPSPPESQTTNVLANQSKGLTQSPPKQAEKESSEAIPITGKSREKKSADNSLNANKQPQQQVQTPPNVVPYGQGGPANAVQFNMGSGTGGLSVSGTGDFEGVYGYYVEAIRRKIGQMWSFYQAGSGVPKGAKVTVAFEIDKNGRPSKVAVEQPSGYSVLDQSAIDTLRRIDTFGPLPDAYRGSSVVVHFYFEAQ